jgi:hypothetical protein
MIVRKAVKKPIEIEYITFEDLDNTTDLANLINGHQVLRNKFDKDKKTSFLIETLEGTMKMTDKDVLIIGVKGEIYPCKKDIFFETYSIIEP